MKLKDFNIWFQQAVEYWSDPNHIDCPDKCVEKLNELKEHVDAYFSNTSKAYVWFKRAIGSMLSYRVSKYHIHSDDPNIPPSQACCDKFTDLLGAFIVDLPDIETLFSTYTQTTSTDSTTSTTDSNCTECGDSTTDPDTGTVTKTCLDTSKVDNLIQTIDNLPEDDYNRIMNFLTSLDETDRALYMMFKRPEITVDTFTMNDIAQEAGLDEVLQVYNWQIPGYNT